jgi:Flp pilus assembly protein TadG
MLGRNRHAHNERVTPEKRSGGDAGQALIETALSLGLLVFTILAGTDLARVFAAQLAVQNSARAGAESSVTRAAANDAAITTYVTDELGRVAGVNPASATITITHTVGAGGEQLVNVRVQYTWRPLTPWPGLPPSFALDRTVTMRQYP